MEIFFFLGGSVSVASTADVAAPFRFAITSPLVVLEAQAPPAGAGMAIALADAVGRVDDVGVADPCATRLIAAGGTGFGGNLATGVADPVSIRMSTATPMAVETDVTRLAAATAMRFALVGASAVGEKNVTAYADPATMQICHPPSPSARGIITSSGPNPHALSGLSGVEVISFGRKVSTRPG